MTIQFHSHAKERMQERGATEEEVRATIENGERYPAKFGRVGYRRNFPFNRERRRKFFTTKQVELFAIQEKDNWIVITVLTRFF